MPSRMFATVDMETNLPQTWAKAAGLAKSRQVGGDVLATSNPGLQG